MHTSALLRRHVLPLAVLLTLGACRSGDEPPPEPPSETAAAVEPAPDEGIQLSAGSDRVRYQAGDSIRVVLRVVNRLQVERTLHFPTAQRYDLTIVTDEGEVVYHWGAERAFAQVLGEERLDPGEWGPEWSERIPAPAEPGGYRIRAQVPVNGTELRTEFPIEVDPG
jgi:hypothetical protein